MKSLNLIHILPHQFYVYDIGAIIDDIQKAGYIITAAQQFYINPINSEEFLEIYKGVLSDYTVSFYLSYIFFLQLIIPKAENIFINICNRQW